MISGFLAALRTSSARSIASGAGNCAGAGSIGDFGSFSMQSTKLMTAGEGGMITTSDGTHEQRLQSLVNCGRKEPGYDGFPERMLGTNARITEWQAAVLREQLRRLPGQHRRRAARIERLGEICMIPSSVCSRGSTAPRPPGESTNCFPEWN